MAREDGNHLGSHSKARKGCTGTQFSGFIPEFELLNSFRSKGRGGGRSLLQRGKNGRLVGQLLKGEGA